MTGHDLRRYLFPTVEKGDPDFSQEIERLSVIGLRVIAAVCIGAPLFVYVFGALWLPDLPPPAMMVADGALLIAGVAGLALSFSPRIRPHARALGIGMGALTALLQTVSMAGSSHFHLSVLQTQPEQHYPVILAVVMIVGVTVLPIKPVQTMELGSAILGLFVVIILSQGGTEKLSGWAGLPILFSILLVVICTALTAVIYDQRASAFMARRRAEKSFEELQRAQATLLVSRNAVSQGRFAAALSHELNTPLGSLASAFETLVSICQRAQGGEGRNGNLAHAFEQTVSSGRSSYERLNDIVARMRQITNLDRAEVQIVDLNELCANTVAFLQRELESRAKVKLDLSPLPPVRCRPQQLSAVLSNLLRNAADATEAGEGRIDISTRERQGLVTIEVRDNGRGIAAERLTDLFEPGFVVKGGRVATTNWSLFVSRSIVAEHDGQLDIESQQGRGTTARIRLPATLGPLS